VPLYIGTTSAVNGMLVIVRLRKAIQTFEVLYNWTFIA